MRTAGSQQSLQRGQQYIQYKQSATAGSILAYCIRSLFTQSTVETCEAHERSRSSILYIQVDISSLVVYAILYMLLAVLYVLGTYVFVSLLLYSMHLESPPERMDKDVNSVIAVKGLKDDRNKSYTHTVSRAYKEHRKTDWSTFGTIHSNRLPISQA